MALFIFHIYWSQRKFLPLEYKGKAQHLKSIKAQSKQNYEMMKAHILKSRKFPQEIKDKLLAEASTKETKAEEKKDGKKSKR